LPDEILRVELDRDEVSAGSRRVEPHRHRVAALGDSPLQGDTVGVKHVASIPDDSEQSLEVAGRENTGSDPVRGWTPIDQIDVGPEIDGSTQRHLANTSRQP